MSKLAERLDVAGKWASVATVMFVGLTVAKPSVAMLTLTSLCLAPAYLMPPVADWLRTKSALEAICAHGRTAVSTLPETCKPLASAEHSEEMLILPIEWDSPSPSIH